MAVNIQIAENNFLFILTKINPSSINIEPEKSMFTNLTPEVCKDPLYQILQAVLFPGWQKLNQNFEEGNH